MKSIKEQVNKVSLLEINEELRQIKPPADVIELVNACTELSGYHRSEIKTSFLRALSLPALSTYINTDKRCRVAIDIVIHKLESRYPDRDQIKYEWKGISARLTGLEAIDKYGNALFSDPWIATPEPLTSVAPALVISESHGHGLEPTPPTAHELAFSPVSSNDSFETLQVLKEISAKLDILVQRGSKT